MFSENQSKARIGKLSIDIKANRYRIRFTYPKNSSHELRIAQVTDDGWLTALRAAKLINQDIDLGIFDDTYAKYSPTHAKRLELAQKETVRSYKIIELWERSAGATSRLNLKPSKRLKKIASLKMRDYYQ